MRLDFLRGITQNVPQFEDLKNVPQDAGCQDLIFLARLIITAKFL
jgi:hypothetical protein